MLVDFAKPRGAAIATKGLVEQHSLHHSLWHSGVGFGSSKLRASTVEAKPSISSAVSIFSHEGFRRAAHSVPPLMLTATPDSGAESGNRTLLHLLGRQRLNRRVNPANLAVTQGIEPRTRRFGGAVASLGTLATIVQHVISELGSRPRIRGRLCRPIPWPLRAFCPASLRHGQLCRPNRSQRSPA